MTTLVIAISAIMGALPLALVGKTIAFHRRQRRFFANLDAQFCADMRALAMVVDAEILAEFAPVSLPAEDMLLAPPDWQNVAAVTSIAPFGGNQ